MSKSHCACALAVCIALVLTEPSTALAQSATFKVATFNIRSGRGQPALPGHTALFADSLNCTDTTQPLNAWGIGFIQQHLRAALSDPSVVALGLSEAWFCGIPSNVRQALGWKASSTERNGVALVARYGFGGPEEWVQLDTSLNINPADTMWVLRVPVCLDAACSATINLFTAHWFAESNHADPQYNTILQASYDRQAVQTASFLTRAGGASPHMLVGDLNTWEGTQRVCGQDPVNSGLERLRTAGYSDGWPLIHGGAEGFTGMTNRAGCGTPDGYVWKRPDYVWSPSNYLPVSIARFGVVPGGDAAPSDHFGLIAEFPWPAVSTPPSTPPPSSTPPPAISAGAGEIVLYARNSTSIVGNWRMTADASAAGGGRLWNPDLGAAKLAAAADVPADYFELSFTADAGRPYRLWIRGKAERDYYGNDSVFVQFSGTVDASAAPVYRIGTTTATTVSVEEGTGMGLADWGWQDNGYGTQGPLLYFATTGPQTIRVQRREDGISIDQIVLSPAAFLSRAPGASRNDATIYTANSGVLAVASPPPASTAEIVLRAANASAIAGAWRREIDATAATGVLMRNPDASTPKITTAATAPANYFELTFNAESGRPYRLWLRGRADGDYWGNDSAFVQFSGSVTQAGAAAYRIGTTEATVVSIEEGSGAGLWGWGWQDNGYGGLGPLIYFATTGPQTIRIQQREDGIAIDQIVLSSATYLVSAPGAPKNDATILP
jgi:hypothetical protein